MCAFKILLGGTFVITLKVGAAVDNVISSDDLKTMTVRDFFFGNFTCFVISGAKKGGSAGKGGETEQGGEAPPRTQTSSPGPRWSPGHSDGHWSGWRPRSLSPSWPRWMTGCQRDLLR